MWSGLRRLPDGRELRWRTQDVGQELDPILPLVIEWDIPEGLHPGETAAAGVELRRVVVGARDPERARTQLEVLARPDEDSQRHEPGRGQSSRWPALNSSAARRQRRRPHPAQG
jgi:hypothetical protein